MTIWWVAVTIGSLLVATLAFIWLAIKISSGTPVKKTPQGRDALEREADNDVEHIFNDDFREELRNHGRLHFEKILNENAMFLQQDLRLTTSQLNDYMKSEVTRTLTEEFKKYEQSIADAKELAIAALQKTNNVIDEQRKELADQLEKEVADAKERLVNQFEANMAQVVNHYILQAIGDQIDLGEQLEYILSDLETNKKAILEDIRHGA